MNNRLTAEEIFHAAREKAEPAERAGFLDGACGNDVALRAKVEALLKADADAGRFLAEGTQADDLDATIPRAGRRVGSHASRAPSEHVGDMIGRYKLLEQIGEGGFGVVYMAEQRDPVKRRVALKVIKLGMDTRQVITRFEAERQALAMMDHPNIARVLDAGSTETGRPYFVMEYIKGVPIVEYCDTDKLDTNARLELFSQVCHAIQHAHQKGIIHRDIKPKNVLVTMHDGVPVPKVIDFGIAKATSAELTAKTLFTEHRQMIGTPAYMSPEQAEMSGLDVDTRSDIYSLGVLLYELLTGTTPFDTKELTSKGFAEMMRIIREVEPHKPSTRISTLGDTGTRTAQQRRATDPKKLSQALKGDLDWIVMKCLEKDRTRRYETANGLAMDIRRYLAGEAILAAPPSAAYRLRKTIRRNKGIVTAGTVVAAALLLGLAGTIWQASVASKQRDKASREAVRAVAAEGLALQSRADSEELSNFMLDDFYDELEPSGQFEAVARLARRVVAYYDGLPASVRTAETDRGRALAQARLAMVTARQGDVKAAMPLAKETAARLEQMRKQGDQSDGTIFALGVALHAQYWCFKVQQDVQSEAGPLQQGVETLRPFATSPDSSRRVRLQYARLLNLQGITQPPEQGVDTCEEALHILEGLGALDLSDLTAASLWADTADSQARAALTIGRLDEAERREKQVLALAERVVAQRPRDYRARMNLTYAPDMLALIEAKRFHDAAALQFATQSVRATELYLQINPSDAEASTMLARCDYGVAALLFRQGRVAEALQQARRKVLALGDRGNNRGFVPLTDWMSGAIARWEAQRGNRSAADHALQEARLSLGAFASRNRMADSVTQSHLELLDDADRQVRLAFGEDATVYEMASQALSRLDNLRQSMTNPNRRGLLSHVQRQALDQAARTALNLGRPGDAETAARTLLSLLTESGNDSAHLSMDQPLDPVWGQVLLAQAACEQGRNAEALQTLEPALAHYHDATAQGAGHVAFCQHFARALYVLALAQPVDGDGTARRRESLDQASKLLNDLSDEARQLHDSKELLSWIAAAQ